MTDSAPLNPGAVGCRSAPKRVSWTARDCMLYALGVGAGPDDLRYTTNNTKGVQQQMVPTMPVTLGVDVSVLKEAGPFDWACVLQAEQRVALLAKIPVAGEADAITEIIGMWDKGKAALIVIETTGASVDGAPLWRSTSSLFIRGVGGWGGERGPTVASTPQRNGPVKTISYLTRPEQALVYRLSGDYNPLHSDPAFAVRAGVGAPILHGLCTFGFAGRALLSLADEEMELTSMSARFAGPVWPGDLLRVHLSQPTDTTVTFTVSGRDDHDVLTSGLATLQKCA